MSDYQGNIIIKNPATPTGPASTGRAPGMWKLNEVAYWIKQGVWPNPAITPDTYFPYVSLLLSTTSLGNANNNLFVDSSGAFNPVSRNGNTMQGSFTPYSTNWSNYFDGSGDYIQTPAGSATTLVGTMNGSTNLTIECWIFPTAYNNNSGNFPGLIGDMSPTSQIDYWSWGLTTTGVLMLYWWIAGTQYRVYTTNTVSLNAWTHIALNISAGAITMYINGVSQTLTGTTTLGAVGGTMGFLAIGQWNNGAASGTDAGNFTGYISNLRIVKASTYSGNFTPSTSPLTAITGTSLLTCQSNRFRDASTNNFTLTIGNDTRVTDFGPFSPAYPGAVYNQSDITNWSGYFDGSGDYLTSPDNAAVQFGSGDFTIEMWVYFSTTSGTQVLLGSRANTGVFAPYQFYYTGGVLYLYGSTNGSSWNIFNGLTVIPSVAAGQWYHVAVVRSGSNFSTYSNGVRQSNTTVSGSLLLSSAPVTIGADASGANPYTGYISNLRMVKGTAVYNPSQSTITVPTTNLTAISGTSLLTLQNAAFTDNSTNNFVITPFGNSTVTGNSPFNTVGYWSNYFDGSGDYLSYPEQVGDLGTADWTLECWAYPTATPPNYASLLNKNWTFSLQTGDFQWSIKHSDGYMSFAYNNGGITNVTTTIAPALNTWTHYAVTRSGTTLRIYANGVLNTTATLPAGLSFGTASTTSVFTGYNSRDNCYYTGYISNLRVVAGTAVYTESTYTVPTTPLTAITNTSLLTCQASRLIDSSVNAYTITRNGDVSVQSFDPFYTATIASNGGSMYFDGSGDYLQVPDSPSLNLSGSVYTVEAWIWTTGNYSNYRTIITKRQNSSSNTCWQIYLNISNGVLSAAFGTTGYNSSVTPPANCWNHVALVYDGTNANLYLNGSRVLQTAVTNTNFASSPVSIGSYPSYGEDFIGYISGVRVLRGVQAYTGTSYTVPTAPANPTAATVLMLNGMNAGIYDGTTINDMETVGNAQVRYPSPFAPADYWAGSFDGSGDYLTVPYSTALQLPGDFTIEAWVYLNSRVTSFPCIVANYSTYAANGGFALFAGHNFNTTKYTVSFNGSFPVLTSSSSIVYGAWTHVAVVRSGSTLTLYINGVSEATATNSATVTGTGDNWWIATSGDSTTSSYINGSISNLRVVKGTAVYTSNFTPSTTPLTAISGTSLLTCQNKTFIDNSTNAIAITSYGNATAGAIGPFTATGGTSMYFDGTGDYLKAPNSDAFAFRTGDFTVEMWAYFADSTATNRPLFDTGVSSNTGRLLIRQGNDAGTSNVVNAFVSGTTIGSPTISFNQWTHVAVVRQSGTVKIYINGTGGTGVSASADLTQNGCLVGAFYDQLAWNFTGYIDDLRVTRGVARYTSNFTPPTQAFPTY